MKTRIEKDTFGPIEVPADRLWGAQTQRSLQNFKISADRMPLPLIRALAQVKRASARVNMDLNVLDRTRATRSSPPPTRSLAGRYDERVPAGRLADRQRHPDQHERERGAGQPRQRAARRRARRGAQGPPQRRRQQGAVVERRLPDGDARRRRRARSRAQLLPAVDAAARHAWRRSARRSWTSSRSAARTCRTRRRSRWGRSSPGTSRQLDHGADGTSTQALPHLLRARPGRHRGRHRPQRASGVRGEGGRASWRALTGLPFVTAPNKFEALAAHRRAVVRARRAEDARRFAHEDRQRHPLARERTALGHRRDHRSPRTSRAARSCPARSTRRSPRR